MMKNWKDLFKGTKNEESLEFDEYLNRIYGEIKDAGSGNRKASDWDMIIELDEHSNKRWFLCIQKDGAWGIRTIKR